jgi:predicted Zn-dependent protease
MHVRGSSVPWPSFAALLVLAAAAGCAINATTGKPQLVVVSEAQEAEIGRKAAEQVSQEMGVVDAPELVGYVASVGQRLVQVSARPDQHFEFQVVDMQEPNAFALPGGYVYVTRGLLVLTNSEDELACVLGHEIGHVLLRHAAQRETRALPGNVLTGITALAAGIVGGSAAADVVGSLGATANSGFLAGYSRDQEREADKLGQELAQRAGYSPAGMTDFLTTLEKEVALETKGKESGRSSFFDSHPSTPERVSATAAYAQELGVPGGAASPTARVTFLQKLDGLILGADARQGVFEDATFLHPELGFRIQFPDGWKTSNRRTLVGAVSPTQDAVVALQVQGHGSDPQAAAQAYVAAQHISVSQSGALLVSQLAAFRVVGVVEGQRGSVPVLLTFIAYRGDIYRVTGLAGASVFQERTPDFDRTAGSFGPLSAAQRSRISQQRLRLATARSGETIERLGVRVRNAWSPEQTAIANALELGTPLEGGRVLKIAREEPVSTGPRTAPGDGGPGPLGAAPPLGNPPARPPAG